MNYSECIENARTRIGNYCKACPECNGRACKNQMPGPGAKGIGDTAIRNYDKWKEIRVQMDTIAENKPVDTSLELFGKKFLYPFFAGPVGAVGLHYGDCLDDVRYNDILVAACSKYGIAVSWINRLCSGSSPDISSLNMTSQYTSSSSGSPCCKASNAVAILSFPKLQLKMCFAIFSPIKIGRATRSSL